MLRKDKIYTPLSASLAKCALNLYSDLTRKVPVTLKINVNKHSNITQ